MSSGTASNATEVLGTVYNGNNTLISFLPSCTNAVGYSDFTVQGADDFDLREWDYYKDNLHYAIGGWVAAGICLLLGIIFMLWAISLCCCTCCCGVRRWSRAERQANAIYKDNPAADPRIRRGFRQRHSLCSILLCTLAVLALLIALATAAWGLAEGIRATHHLSDDFWIIIDTARTKVGNLRNTVSAFFTGVTGLSNTLHALSATLASVDLTSLERQINLPINLTGVVSGDAANALGDVASSLDSVVASGNTVVDQIQRYGVQTLADLEHDHKAQIDDVQNKWTPLALGLLFGTFVLLAPLRRRPTTFYDCAQVQNKWIPLGLGLLFGIFVVLALVATALLLARRVRTGSFFLTLLWFWTALYFFAGTGLLRFGNKFTDDTCLYPEHFVFKVVNDTGSLSIATRGRVTTGLEYYFGAFGSTVTLDEIINEIYGIDLAFVSNLVNEPVVNQTIFSLTSSAAQGILQAQSNLNSTQQQALADAPQSLSDIIQYFAILQRQMARSNYEPLYDDVKTLLCCTLANGVEKAWIAYTVASTFAALLCIVLSVRALQAARGYTSKAPPLETQYIVGGKAGGPPQDSAVGTPVQSHPPPYSGTNGNGYDGSSYSGNGYNANGYLPASGPSYGAGRPPSWPTAQPAYNGGGYAPFKEGV